MMDRVSHIQNVNELTYKTEYLFGTKINFGISNFKNLYLMMKNLIFYIMIILQKSFTSVYTTIRV